LLNRRYLPPSSIRAAVRHAADETPDECCGLIIDGICRPSLNAIDHSADRQFVGLAARQPHFPSERGPTKRTGFLLPARDAITLAEAWHAASTGIAIYHSHPDAPAVWSATDERSSRFAGRPAYPDVPRLIIGCRDGNPFEVRQFEYRGTTMRCTIEYDLDGKVITDLH
jgi:proteasome lid subunit RPN8/RPN11